MNDELKRAVMACNDAFNQALAAERQVAEAKRMAREATERWLRAKAVLQMYAEREQADAVA